MTTAALPPRLLTIAHGHVLIDYTHKADAKPGDTYANGVALFAAPAGEHHTFVVWTLIDRGATYVDGTPKPDDQRWMVERGDYAGSLGYALVRYADRGGQAG